MKSFMLAALIVVSVWQFEVICEALLHGQKVRVWSVLILLVGAVGIATKRIGVW